MPRIKYNKSEKPEMSEIDKETIQYMQEMIEHQHRQISDLSDMLILQGRDIKMLEAKIKKLHGKLDMLDSEGAGGADKPALSVSEEAALNKPPHY